MNHNMYLCTIYIYIYTDETPYVSKIVQYGISLLVPPPLPELLSARQVDALPEFLDQHQLPWPWPGGIYLLGRSMGGGGPGPGALGP